jgi:threonine/homoserine/homoserine lactone efflux protein
VEPLAIGFEALLWRPVIGPASLPAARWAQSRRVDARFAAYLAVAVVLIVTPGPDTALVIRNAFRSGRRAAVFSALGIGAGSAVWAVASLLGVAVLLETSAVGFTFFKLLGAAYLGYLGLRTLFGSIRQGPRSTGSGAPPAARRPLRDRAALGQGLLNNLLNPKAGAIFVTVFPQFIAPGDPPLRLLAMLLAFEATLLIWLSLYGLILGRAGSSPLGARASRYLERMTGAVMIGLGVRLALDRR